MKPFYFGGYTPVYNKPIIFEQWKRVDSSVYPNADGPSWVSTFGRVWSENTCTIVQPCHNRDGYCTINVKVNNKHTSLLLHRCIMIAFYPVEGYEKLDVNHNDGNKDNCSVTNLCWATRSENNKYAYMNGQRKIIGGVDHYKAKLTAEEADKIGYLLQQNELTKNEIAELMGCTSQMISHIANGTTYKNIYKKYSLYKVRKMRK